MNQEKIGKFIAKKRKEKHLTQEQLAEKLYVTNKSISRWENGKTMPDLSIFTLLAEELDVSVNDLMSGEIVDKKEYQNEFEKNMINSLSLLQKESNKKFKYIIKVSLFLLIMLICIFLFSNIKISLKYDSDKMYVENNKQYGLRFVNKDSCTIFKGDIHHIIKTVTINKEKSKIIFVNAQCTINDYYVYNMEDGNSFRYDNFKLYSKDLTSKYKVYYTRTPINKIKNMNNNDLLMIINDSKLIYKIA